MKDDNEDIPEYLDAESYRSGSQVDSFQQLVFQQIGRVTKLGSVEFVGSWWLKIIKKEMVVQKYIEDTRSAYINGVWSLYDLLEPYFQDDAPLNKETKIVEPELIRWNKQLSELEKNFSNKIGNIGLNKDKQTEAKQEHLNKKAELFRVLFRILCGVIKRANNFAETKARAR